MRYTSKRSLASVKAAVTLIYACMNLKKLVKTKWRRTQPEGLCPAPFLFPDTHSANDAYHLALFFNV